jgi:protein-L-isoaspartate O-methyltransferase
MAKDSSRCKMEYKKDELGNEVLLKEGKFQVMMEWEKPYMQACIDALKPFGDVLEVGFGLGYSATHIQSYKPKSHTIIEFHPEIAAKAREWAKQYPNVIIVEDTWQNALSRLKIFDCIFFDDYPLQSEEEMQKMEEESAQSSLVLKQGAQVIQEVEKTLPFLKELKYSDSDLDALMKEVATGQANQWFPVARFFKELFERRQISESQFQHRMDAMVKGGHLTKEELTFLLTPPKKDPFAGTQDRLYLFLSECLKSHMRKNSRFSCFLSSAVSKFEDERFFNAIITNPDLDFHEEEMTLEVPPNCGYFSGDKALVITITKCVE